MYLTYIHPRTMGQHPRLALYNPFSGSDELLRPLLVTTILTILVGMVALPYHRILFESSLNLGPGSNFVNRSAKLVVPGSLAILIVPDACASRVL